MSDPFNYLSRATHTAKVRSSYGPLAYFSYIFISGKNVAFSVTQCYFTIYNFDSNLNFSTLESNPKGYLITKPLKQSVKCE